MLQIKHNLPGRIRFYYSKLYRNQVLEYSLLEEFKTHHQVHLIRCNIRCASIIIEYDNTLLKVNDLIKIITNTSEQHSPARLCMDHESQCRCIATNSEQSLSDRKFQFIASSSIMAIVLFASKILGLAVRQSLFSPLGLACSFFAVPLLKNSLEDALEKKSITLNTFLGAGIAASILGGEALTALEILWIHSGAELLEGYVAEKSRKAVSNILDVTSSSAFVIRNNEEIEVHVNQLTCGETIIIHTGEKVPVDGPVLKGEAVLNESSINGNSELVHKIADNYVYAGTYVQEGTIWVSAEKIGDQTYLSRIMKMVDDTLENKAPIELEADRLARQVVKIGLLMTGATFLITGSLYSAFSVLLVMACPCATTLAASSAVSSALSNAASNGILIKGGKYLEKAGEQSSFCFDKTGTLTSEHPVITDIIPFNNYSEEDVLKCAAIAELHSRHPIAHSIREKADEAGFEHAHHTVCESILGMGVRAESAGKEYFIGNQKLLAKYAIDSEQAQESAIEFASQGKTTVFVAEERALIGMLCIENRIKEGVAQTLARLRKDGVKELIMVTGDEKNSAEGLADKLDFDLCYSSVLPDEKAKIVQEIQTTHKVAMVGDGINDVLALASSDIGIAMGTMGADVAIESADIALVDDNLEKILYLRKLSHETIKVVNQNFMLATGSNILGALLGMAGILNPVMAGLIHIAHTGGIMVNSARLLSYKDKSTAEETTQDV